MGRSAAAYTKMPAVFAFHTGKTVLQIAAIQIAVDHLCDIRPPETILP